MPSHNSTMFNTNPYFDDFNEDKKFLRMLFRPGYAVQSRELTQLQTMLQNQIERFGNHVFKDGARIVGGEISTQTLDFIRLDPETFVIPTFELTSTDLVGYNLINYDNVSGLPSVTARVIDFIPKTDTDPYGIAVISYLSGTGFALGSTLGCDNPNKQFVAKVSSATTTTLPHTGKCRVVGTNEGIYYVSGFFIKTSSQFEAAYTTPSATGHRVFNTPTGIMGFGVDSIIITEKDDYSIKDPANGSYNYNAPGSHRYKIDLTLKFLAETTDQNFIPLVTYTDGVITKKVDVTQYSDIIKLFAQRTYDESGNYIVKPFDVSFRNGTGSTHYADVGSGKAYVFGYEYETKFKDTIDIPCARTTKSYVDHAIDNYYGNYIIGQYSPVNGCDITSLLSSIQRNIGQNTSAVKVYGATGPDISTAIFSARLLKVEPNDNIYTTQGATMALKAYLSDVVYLNTSGTNDSSTIVNLYQYDEQINLSRKLLNNVARPPITETLTTLPKFNDPEKNSLVYPLNGTTPVTLIKSVDKISYIHETFRGFVVDAANPYPSISLVQGEEFNWCLANGFVPTGNSISLGDNDGYYLIYASGSGLSASESPGAGYRIGTILKIVGPSTTLPYIPGTQNPQTKVTANISGEGDFVTITSPLPFGGYYLVGKSKNISPNISTSTDVAAKIRNKTKQVATENISNTTASLNTFKRVISRNTSGSIHSMYFVLNRSDVLSIDTITTNGANIGNQFLFDNGQRDAKYQLARLYVKPEYFSLYETGKSFQIVVNYTYFEHSGYGPFLKESYSGISYDQIPVYVSAITDKTLHLANAIDFRYQTKIIGYSPSGATAGSTTSTTESEIFNMPIYSYTNGFAPMPFSIVNTHEGYLPRIDKLVVSKNISNEGDITTLQRIAGTPSDSPIVPEDLGDSMTLFVMSVPAFTFNAVDIKAEQINNSRYTMKDIGNISKRVNNLEQYAILNDLELDVVSRTMSIYGYGNNSIKKAILVDTFDGHSIADVTDVDHRCSIDIEQGELRASFNANAYDFGYVNQSGLTKTYDNIICANFTKFDPPVISQKKTSTTIQVNHFGLPNWVGNIWMTPSADYWFDRSVRPITKINNDGANDAWVASKINNSTGYGSQWNDWESLWTGISTELPEAESAKNAAFFSKNITKNSSGAVNYKFVASQGIEKFADSVETMKGKYTTNLRKKDFYTEVAANTILNKSVVPKMRGTTILFIAYNLKPHTQVHVFFDNVNVDAYCLINGLSGPFYTSEKSGTLGYLVLTIPDGMFEVGEKILRVIDSSTNNIEDATTIAEAVYYCSGIKQDDYSGVASIRPAEIRKQTPNSNKVISSPLYRQKSLNTTKFNQWIDPLSQTFEVSETTYPNGYYMESVDLYLSEKDDNLPITIEICPVVNGIPFASVILPFSTVIKYPSGITANASTPTATNFKFATPVYLTPGMYSLLVRANTSKYSLFAANIGDIDTITDERITTTFPGGMLFRAQNSAEASGDPNIDLMFQINRCQFDSPPTTIALNHIDQDVSSRVNLVQPSIFAFTPPGVALSTQIVLGSDTYQATPNRNLKLNTTYTMTDNATLDLILKPIVTQLGISTFMLDIDRTNVIVVENVINSSDSTTQEISPTSGKTDETARYISKKVSLPTGTSATALQVILDANIQANTFIRVYAKLFNTEQLSTSIEDQPYVVMTEITPNGFTNGGSRTYSLNSNDFKEMSFQYNSSPSSPNATFNTFAVKICMYSTDASKSPVLKNLRIVALS